MVVGQETVCTSAHSTEGSTIGIPGFVCAIQPHETDLKNVDANSMLIRTEILIAICLGGLNLHVSLVSGNRGHNPTEWTFFRGINRTGLTLHEMMERFHEGPITAQ
jgi:methionyl-tRNA formyltransferase